MEIEKVFVEVCNVFQYDNNIQIKNSPCGQQFLLYAAHSIYISIAALYTGYEIALLSSDNKIQPVVQLGYDPVKPVQQDEIVEEIEKIKKFFLDKR